MSDKKGAPRDTQHTLQTDNKTKDSQHTLLASLAQVRCGCYHSKERTQMLAGSPARPKKRGKFAKVQRRMQNRSSATLTPHGYRNHLLLWLPHRRAPGSHVDLRAGDCRVKPTQPLLNDHDCRSTAELRASPRHADPMPRKISR